MSPPVIGPSAARNPLVEGLLVCVGGSIAAAGVPRLLQILLERGTARGISIVLSERSGHFVAARTLAVLTGSPCVVDLFEDAEKGRATHVDLARKCQAAVVVPATANLVGKLANGIADCTVSTVLSVFGGPVVVVPAVHPTTAKKPSFLRNLAQLEADGYTILGPVDGYSVSEGTRELGPGAMPGPEDVASFIERVLQDLPPAGRCPRAATPEET
jgi:phosphopantothenoylcysteine decarboxylase / phosphopantothenate---cysteine ligase